MANPTAMSYEQQLKALQDLYEELVANNAGTTEKTLILSLAESVKQAREHNLNCRKPG